MCMFNHSQKKDCFLFLYPVKCHLAWSTTLSKAGGHAKSPWLAGHGENLIQEKAAATI